ncbi:PAN2-PAN3 deadenylation complex subunit PAN3 [Frankliniella fusca]|uniref:PAN2-PAN3 deadenylation complex subunit PAN3 n=1 Tax=Frankliniella fusca TaxID=407009 RepID=A0AAE1L896_9NEOP|nr:PAN2-PAN3 deadenylation complex subunit PAN3 [Frankliniella fusca]
MCCGLLEMKGVVLVLGSSVAAPYSAPPPWVGPMGGWPHQHPAHAHPVHPVHHPVVHPAPQQHRSTRVMFIPESLRSCMVEPDVSTYLQAPSSGQTIHESL